MPWERWVREQSGAEVVGSTVVQTLWGGCGQLLRLALRDGRSVILKHVEAPSGGGAGEERKRRSYKVEWAWYAQVEPQDDCRTARCLAQAPSLLLLEDLGQSGFRAVRPVPMEATLQWLAAFHRRFLGPCPEGLWEQGTYWHLGTRPDEWRRLPHGSLKERAAEFDARLRGARFQTVCHGDAKPSNFLWRGDEAAAVDFQYVGPGPGIRDVAYLLDCCGGDVLAGLDRYFAHLALPEVEAEWRPLFPVAWSDFQRFYHGWAPGQSLDAFGREMLAQACDRGGSQ